MYGRELERVGARCGPHLRRARVGRVGLDGVGGALDERFVEAGQGPVGAPVEAGYAGDGDRLPRADQLIALEIADRGVVAETSQSSGAGAPAAGPRSRPAASGATRTRRTRRGRWRAGSEGPRSSPRAAEPPCASNRSARNDGPTRSRCRPATRRAASARSSTGGSSGSIAEANGTATAAAAPTATIAAGAAMRDPQSQSAIAASSATPQRGRRRAGPRGCGDREGEDQHGERPDIAPAPAARG